MACTQRSKYTATSKPWLCSYDAIIPLKCVRMCVVYQRRYDGVTLVLAANSIDNPRSQFHNDYVHLFWLRRLNSINRFYFRIEPDPCPTPNADTALTACLDCQRCVWRAGRWVRHRACAPMPTPTDCIFGRILRLGSRLFKDMRFTQIGSYMIGRYDCHVQCDGENVDEASRPKHVHTTSARTVDWRYHLYSPSWIPTISMMSWGIWSGYKLCFSPQYPRMD